MRSSLILLRAAWMSLLTIAASRSFAQSSAPIEVRVNSDYPPYESLDKSGSSQGFDVDIVRASADASHLPVHVLSGQWSTVRAELNQGKIDLLAGMLYSPERAKNAEFGSPYMTVEYSVFVRVGSTPIRSASALDGRIVLVENGSQMHDQLKSTSRAKLIAAQSEPDALKRLARGEGDAALVPLLEGLVLVHDGVVSGVEPTGEPLFARDLCFAAKKGNTALIARLDTGLAIIRSNGTYSSIYDKWFGAVEPSGFPWKRFVKWLGLGLLAVLGGIAVAATWVVVLRREVRSRTLALNAEFLERQRVDTELRQNEEMYRNLFESANDGIFISDAAMKLVDVNQTAANMFGYSRAEMIGMSVHSLIDRRELEVSPVKAAELQSGQSIILERLYVRKDGSTFVGEVGAMLNSNGLVQAILRDVTIRREFEDRLKQINEELEQRVEERTSDLAAAFKELEAFSYSVSHDLRTPLRTIIGFSTLLRREYEAGLPDEAQDYLRRVDVAAHRMADLIDDLLAYARAGRQELRFTEFSPSDLATAVWKELEEDWRGNGVSIVVEEMPFINADSVLVKQLYHNLLSNAIKFCRSCPNPQVTAGYDTRQGAFFVRDNGLGFDPQYHDKMFEVFERLHSEEIEGTGVGLAIVKRVAERHGGDVWAESNPGDGATFWFRLRESPSHVDIAAS